MVALTRNSITATIIFGARVGRNDDKKGGDNNRDSARVSEKRVYFIWNKNTGHLQDAIVNDKNSLRNDDFTVQLIIGIDSGDAQQPDTRVVTKTMPVEQII